MAFIEKISCVTSSEKDDIEYLLTTIAERSLFSLFLIKSDLEAARARLAHVDLIQFLYIIFSSPSLVTVLKKICLGPLWDYLLVDIKTRFTSSYSNNQNFTELFIDLIKCLGKDPLSFQEPLNNQDWEACLKILLDL